MLCALAQAGDTFNGPATLALASPIPDEMASLSGTHSENPCSCIFFSIIKIPFSRELAPFDILELSRNKRWGYYMESAALESRFAGTRSDGVQGWRLHVGDGATIGSETSRKTREKAAAEDGVPGKVIHGADKKQSR